MDLAAGCKEKLSYFRIKELKDVLTQLGLSKQGKKQDLVDRILAIFSDEQDSKIWPKKSFIRREEFAKLIDDTYRKIQVSGATDLASKGQGVLDSSTTKIKGEVVDFHSDTNVRCLCGSQFEGVSMIKCDDPRCSMWQHINCVIIPEKPMEGNPPVPDLFYCELCRLSRADPFWVSVTHPLNAVKLTATNIPTDGSNPVQSVEKTFHLTRADKDLLTKQEYDVQAWCMLLNDKVPFRMQWPQYADLQVNGIAVRAINRPGSQLLGVNGRDDGPIITPCTKDGINKISLTGCDARVFCLGVRIVKRQTVLQILNLIPKEGDGERFEDALARVCRCVGGGNGADNADSDSDLEVVADSFGVNLRCPMSGSRMKVAGRFKPCAHMGCFDLEVFVEMNQRSRKWQCPICLKNYSLEHVIIDPYFNRITSKMQHCSEELTEIEVKPDGSWRVKTRTQAERREIGDLAQWHNPDGTLCVLDDSEKLKVDMAKEIKHGGASEGQNGTGLKLGIRKNRNGFWEVSKPDDMNTSSSGNRLQDKFENYETKVIPMSSSATASVRDGEDPSVNQDGGGNFDFMNNGVELDSLSLNVESAYGFSDRNLSATAGNAEVIVLSDSDDDDDMPLSSRRMYKNNQTEDRGASFMVSHPGMADNDLDGMHISSGSMYRNNRTGNGGTTFTVSHPGMGDVYPEDPALTVGSNASLGNGALLFNPNDDEFGMPIWPLTSGTQAGSSFQLFTSDVSDDLIDLQHGPINCSTSMNCYTIPADTVMGSPLVADSSVGRSDMDTNDGLVDNPLAFGGEDPSLQIFLPSRPSNASMQSDQRDQADASNSVRTEDWISLRLGGVPTGSHQPQSDMTSVNGSSFRQEMQSTETTLHSMSDTASLLDMNAGKSEQANRQRPGSPFSFPRQKRSVRPRLNLSINPDYLSIDSDSE